MEELMIGLVLLVIALFIFAKVKDCGSNPEYEAWVTQDKAKYPEFYTD
jgi:hypothetical protein